MIYIAFLQGINAGKYKVIPMDKLRHLFESLGFKKVQTYLKSENVLFESDKDEVSLRKMIEREIVIIYGYIVPVVLRTAEELELVITNCPFSKDKIRQIEVSTGESLYISFLKQVPSIEKFTSLSINNDEGDEFQIVEREVYLLFKNGIKKSKLTKNLQILDIHATIRKWNTICKLHDLSSNMIRDFATSNR